MKDKLVFNGEPELSENSGKELDMWISKKCYIELENRVSALERKSQGQQIQISLDIPNCSGNDLIIKDKKEWKVKCGIC